VRRSSGTRRYSRVTVSSRRGPGDRARNRHVVMDRKPRLPHRGPGPRPPSSDLRITRLAGPSSAEGALFRPDISQVGADRARVMRCRRSLPLADGCCRCCHRCCHSHCGLGLHLLVLLRPLFFFSGLAVDLAVSRSREDRRYWILPRSTTPRGAASWLRSRRRSASWITASAAAPSPSPVIPMTRAAGPNRHATEPRW
jgi:hypothetical protein